MHGSRHLTSPGPSDCDTDSPPLKSHSHTASAAPAASFKRPYQNCPNRISSRSSHRCRGSPDRVLSFVGYELVRRPELGRTCRKPTLQELHHLWIGCLPWIQFPNEDLSCFDPLGSCTLPVDAVTDGHGHG